MNLHLLLTSLSCGRCDRIMWFGEGLKQHFYNRNESKLSDHRPVKAVFTSQVKVLQTVKGFRSFFLSERFDMIPNRLKIPLNHEF